MPCNFRVSSCFLWPAKLELRVACFLATKRHKKTQRQTVVPPTCDTYVWDKLNRVDLITQQSAHNPLSATWSGRVATTRKIDLNYFADSTVQSISRTQGTGTATTAALVTTVTTVADGVKNEGRIASITQSGLTGGNVAYLYGYDDHGRVASFTSPAGTRTYAYDTFDQVTGATGGTQTAETFAYDTNGNRTSVAPASGGGSAVIGSQISSKRSATLPNSRQSRQGLRRPSAIIWNTTASATSPAPMIQRPAPPTTETCLDWKELATNTPRNAVTPAENRIPLPA